MSGKKTRTCPLCAETVKADAAKCRSCGSTLFGADLGFPGGDAKKSKKDEADPWASLPREGEHGDVGLPGAAAVVGGLATYGIACWFTYGAPLAVAVLVGAVSAFGVARAVSGARPSA